MTRMSGARPDLLKPSLVPDLVVARPPFSDGAVFIAAFFGGPIAALGMFAWNVQRLGRIRRDAVIVAVGLAFYLFWMLSPYGDASPRSFAFLGDLFGSNVRTLMLRLIALAIFVVSLLLHRREQRSADLFSLGRPSPWLPVIGSIVVGTVADALLREPARMSTDAADVSSDERMAQAGELLDRGRTVLARDLLRDALKASPEHSGLLYQAARADAMDGDTANAVATLHRLLEKSPDYAPARFLLLSLLTDGTDLPAAEALALELIADYPRSAWLYAAYARVMLRALQLGKGRELAQEALRIDPDEQEALRVMALCDIVDGTRGQDEQALRRLIVEHPDDHRTLAMVTVALAHKGKTAEALRCARLLLRADPGEPAWLNLVRELRYQRHWSLIPLRPLQRWGWGASIGLWVVGMIVVRMVGRTDPELANMLGWTIFGYAVYSWVWPSLLRRLMLSKREEKR